MKYEDLCKRETLAAAGPCRVDACSCGRIHLHLGPVSMCLDPGVLQHVAAAAAEADRRMRLARGLADAPVGPALGAPSWPPKSSN